MERYENIDVLITAHEIRIQSGAMEAPLTVKNPKMEKLLIGLSEDFRHQRHMTEDELITLGTQLFKLIYNEQTTDTLEQAYNLIMSKGRKCRLRLEIIPDYPELAELPWECMYDYRQGRFIATSKRANIIRYVRPSAAVAFPPSPNKSIRLLAVEAAPHDLSSPRTAFTALFKYKTHSLMKEKKLECRVLSSATIEALRQELKNEQYTIIHLACHIRWNQAGGEIAFEDASGNARWIKGEDLAEILKNQQPQLIVLEAFNTPAIAPVLVKSGIPATVGFNYSVIPESMEQFLHTFYAAITDGLPVDRAAMEGRKSIFFSFRSDSPSWGSVVLYASSPVEGIIQNEPRKHASAAAIRGGDVIYTGGGMAVNINSSASHFSGAAVACGDIIGTDKISSETSSNVSTDAGKSTGGTMSATTMSFDHGEADKYLQDLEELIAASNLTSAQRVQGFAYLEKLERLLTADEPDRLLVEMLSTRVAQLSAELAEKAQSFLLLFTKPK